MEEASASTRGKGDALGSEESPYDVFISHCGDDCKHDFADVLYRELKRSDIRSFFDNASLRPGDNAWEAMLGAMRTAKFGIVILTKGFFEREWCVKELETFLERENVIPIFMSFEAPKEGEAGKILAGFDSFKWSLEEYMGIVGKATRSTGVRLTAHEGSWGECIADVKRELLRLLGQLKGGVTLSEYGLPLVGIEESVIELKVLMGVSGSTAGDGGKARLVGVRGMGGVGKTTLAKRVYDDPEVRDFFNGQVCWVEVHQNAGDKVCKLQQQILSRLADVNVPVTSPTEGHALIRERLGRMKVLVCLDDVLFDGHPDILSPALLGPGSCILQTTRDARTLAGGERLDLSGLGLAESVQLFSFHAFEGCNPPVELVGLTERSLRVCAGLPLALKVVGGAVSDWCLAEGGLSLWEDLLQDAESDSWQEDGIHSVLQSSCASLPDDLRTAFILVASIWSPSSLGLKRSPWVEAPSLLSNEVVVWSLGAVLGGSNAKARRVLKQLEDRSLMSWTKESECRGSMKDSVLVTVIAVHDLLVNVATRLGNMLPGTFNKEVRGGPLLSWEASEHSYLHTTSAFEFSLANCSFQRNAIKSLVIEGSGLEGISSWCAIDLSGFESCQLLMLRVSTLRQLPESLGLLENLRVLDLSNCTHLTALPEAIGRAGALVRLILFGCLFLQRLPKSLGRLSRLVELDMVDCSSMQSLPDALGLLSSLEKLDMCGQLLTALPDTMGQLVALRNLDLSKCFRLEVLPESLGQLANLETLDLDDDHSLKKLPKDLGAMKRLTRLCLTDCSILKLLPESLGQLQALTELNIDGCKCLEALPESFARLTGLWSLNLSNCRTLKVLPGALKGFARLTHLDMGGCEQLVALPEHLGTLKLLTVLGVPQWADAVSGLTGLMRLQVEGARELRSIPTALAKLTKLEKLSVMDCTTLCELPESLGKLQGLVALRVINCQDLKTLPDSLGQLTGLLELDLKNCQRLETLPKMGQLTKLRRLFLNDCNVLKTLPETLEKLSSIQGLKMSVGPAWCDVYNESMERWGHDISDQRAIRESIALRESDNVDMAQLGEAVMASEKRRWLKASRN